MQSYIKLCELIMASITWGLAAQPLDSLPRFGEISDHVIPPVQLRPPSTVEARNCESFYTPSLSVWDAYGLGWIKDPLKFGVGSQ